MLDRREGTIYIPRIRIYFRIKIVTIQQTGRFKRFFMDGMQKPLRGSMLSEGIQMLMINMKKVADVALFLLFVTMVQTSCSYKITGKGRIRVGDFIVHDTLAVIETDTLYCYPFILPKKGNYTIYVHYNSDKAYNEKRKNSDNFNLSTYYETDTILQKIQIVDSGKILLDASRCGRCRLNADFFDIYFNTRQNNIPVNKPLELRLSFPRMECKYTYDDVMYFVSFQRAGWGI